MTPASARQLADDLRAGNPVTPTRGPGRLVTWREAARILGISLRTLYHRLSVYEAGGRLVNEDEGAPPAS